MNRYLQAKRDEYEGLRKSIDGFQTRAADENRDLTEVELTTVTEQGAQARKLLAEIESLTEIEHRNRQVAKLAADLDSEPEPEPVSRAKVTARDPGHYRSEKEGGRNSFFADLVRSREGDDEARTRLQENEGFQVQSRALTSSSAGTGVLPPKWLTDEFAAIARQTRRVADRVRNIPITDARPLSLPKQTAGISVATQSSESSATSFTDAWTSGVDTVTPTTQVGGQKVSRQLLDGASPAVDQLIYGDLVAAYNSKVETLVCSAMVTGAGTAFVAYATDATAYATAVTPTATGTPLLKDIRKTATSVRNLRKLPPDIIVAAVSRYGGWLDITDTQGRPVIVVGENNPMNAFGTGSAMVDGRILGLDVVATDGLPFQTYPESILVARSADTLLFESATLRFRYDEPDGPETVRLGVWGYAVAFTRYANASVQRLQVTAA